MIDRFVGGNCPFEQMLHIASYLLVLLGNENDEVAERIQKACVEQLSSFLSFAAVLWCGDDLRLYKVICIGPRILVRSSLIGVGAMPRELALRSGLQYSL